MKRLLLLPCIGLLFAAAPPDPVTWKAQDPPAKAVKAGGRFDLKLVARIQEGWHLYSMKPLAEGPIPTRIWVAEGQPFQLASSIKAAEPQTVQDPSFNMEVELYEGEADFTLPLKITPSPSAGAQNLVINASYQSCNNKICLPPKTVKIEVPVNVTK